MNEKTFVCCHAPSLALLLYESVCSTSDQKGFLLGSIKTHVLTSTTDENEANEEEKTVIYIEHCLPVNEREVLGVYGELSTKFIESYHVPFGNRIVGWYSFRRNSRTTRCSIKESIIHKSLLNATGASPETFALALFSTAIHPSYATHTFNHTFHRLNRGQIFEPLRFKIYTLSDKVTNNSGYLLNMTFPMSHTFENVMSAATSDGKDDSNIRKIHAIHQNVYHCLSEACRAIVAGESRRAKLQRAVDELKFSLGLNSRIPVVAESSRVPRQTEMTYQYLPYDPQRDYAKGRSRTVISVVDDGPSSGEEQEHLEKELISESQLAIIKHPPPPPLQPSPQLSYAASLNKHSPLGDSAIISCRIAGQETDAKSMSDNPNSQLDTFDIDCNNTNSRQQRNMDQ